MIYLLNNGNPYHNYLVNKYVPAHLEQLGYTDEDIVEQHIIAPKSAANHSVYHPRYMVIFKDEPQLEYLYGLTKKKKNVVQFCEKIKVVDKNGGRSGRPARHTQTQGQIQLCRDGGRSPRARSTRQAGTRSMQPFRGHR